MSARGRVGLTAVAGAVVVVALLARVVSSGLGAVERGDAALAQGDELAATVAYREAVSWYLPLVAPWRAEGAEALWKLHERQVAEARVADAVRTLQSLRSGILGSWSLLHPDQELLARVDTALPPLMATWEASAATAEGRALPGPRADREQWFADRLASSERPARPWSVLAVVGFLVWIGAGVRATRVSGRSRAASLAIAAIAFAGMLAGVGLA